jgi:hypothetical protein
MTLMRWRSTRVQGRRAALIEALGDPQVFTVTGDHGWLIGDPGRFVEVLTNVLAVVDGVDGPTDGRVA